VNIFITFFLLYQFANIVLLYILFIIDLEFLEKHHHRACKKAQRKDFVQRMHARNGNASFLYICYNLLLVIDCMLRYIASLIFNYYIFLLLLNQWIYHIYTQKESLKISPSTKRFVLLQKYLKALILLFVNTALS